MNTVKGARMKESVAGRLVLVGAKKRNKGLKYTLIFAPFVATFLASFCVAFYQYGVKN